MYGIIDIGSNTMRLSCYRVVDKKLKPIFHKKEMAGLAGYIEQGNCLSEQGLEKAITVLQDFLTIVRCVGLDQLFVIATASFRNVSNTQQILEQIRKRTGLEVDVLSGEEEAMCDFRGATYFTERDSGIVLDIGGGSTELVSYNINVVEEAVSIPIGSLNTFSTYVSDLFPTIEEEQNIRHNVKKQLENLGLIQVSKQQKIVLGVGGTNRACAKLFRKFYNLKEKDIEMECGMIRSMLHDYMQGEREKYLSLLKIVPDRIHTVLPGMIILDEINQFYGCEKVQLSSWGVREGYLLAKLY